MLDINLFRVEKGNDPEIIRESQRRRFEAVEIVDEIIQGDKDLRQRQFELDQLLKDFNKRNKEMAKRKIAGADASSIIKNTEENKHATLAWAYAVCQFFWGKFMRYVGPAPGRFKLLTDSKKKEVEEARTNLYKKLEMVGNLVDDSVPVSNDEANNVIIRTWGEKRNEAKLLNHVELVEKLEIADLKRGANVAGHRGYYLKGVGVRLNQALINFALDFLDERNYTVLQTPFFMQKDVMSKCSQLAEFDEELYKVKDNQINPAKLVVGAEPEKLNKKEDDKYLIATAEQPLCAYHMDDWIHPSQLPIRYAGYSSCFRREAGSHGRDTRGIFRVHQFEKIEQFCITSPVANDDENSWKMHEEMLKNSEDFYQMLKLPYQVVAIVSGALNNAAAKKYDLEAWFPASSTYRELVSCSNCTDYQSRKLEIRYGQKGSDQTKQYCHLLNSTLTATERTICCILENYQTKDGVQVPEVLQPYMGGKTFLSFPEAPAVKNKNKIKSKPV